MDLNEISIKFRSLPQNVSFARATLGAFLTQVEPTVEELYDIKMALSEAVTNAIIHGYEGNGEQYVEVKCSYNNEKEIVISVKDTGKGIADIEQAKTALFTTMPGEERAGLGFTVMESVVDKVDVESTVSVGTTITLHTKL
ncbi:MAG: anti-sigma F factor [Epulopiscium sp. Nele67-Bin001]|nr:MAG: anti-sigma F factor [Epulopiscium sp. Nuni2H_MBin001]OON94493.1 MAG: anti-sigma F factor [Epulopiscium sp. Nele67-Bin001]